MEQLPIWVDTLNKVYKVLDENKSHKILEGEKNIVFLYSTVTGEWYHSIDEVKSILNQLTSKKNSHYFEDIYLSRFEIYTWAYEKLNFYIREKKLKNILDS